MMSIQPAMMVFTIVAEALLSLPLLDLMEYDHIQMATTLILAWPNPNLELLEIPIGARKWMMFEWLNYYRPSRMRDLRMDCRNPVVNQTQQCLRQRAPLSLLIW